MKMHRSTREEGGGTANRKLCLESKRYMDIPWGTRSEFEKRFGRDG